MKAKTLGFLVLILLPCIFIACGGSADETTTSSLPAGPPDRVEVNYFYESDACFCLGLASEWIDTTITTDYKDYIDSGKFIYNRYDTKDPANSAVIAEFNAASYGLYITSVRGSDRTTHAVGGLWLYTDPTGKNEMIKSKFINLLKSELDKALAGE
jgi:hypothetical protein